MTSVWRKQWQPKKNNTWKKSNFTNWVMEEETKGPGEKKKRVSLFVACLFWQLRHGASLAVCLSGSILVGHWCLDQYSWLLTTHLAGASPLCIWYSVVIYYINTVWKLKSYIKNVYLEVKRKENTRTGREGSSGNTVNRIRQDIIVIASV